jgi:hypothetical protein
MAQIYNLQRGDLILSQAPGDWSEIYVALDEADFPEDFLADRDWEVAEVREEL